MGGKPAAGVESYKEEVRQNTNMLKGLPKKVIRVTPWYSVSLSKNAIAYSMLSWILASLLCQIEVWK